MVPRTLPLLLLLACSNDGAKNADTEGVTFHRDVRPVMERACNQCHSADNIAPFTLETYDEVYVLREAIRSAVVVEKTMPPWLAADGCDDYYGDFSLTADEIALIDAWVEAGAPEGKAADYVEPEDDGDEPAERGLPVVDHTLEMKTPYLPLLEPDDYRCFVLDWPNPAPVTVVTGIDVKPGDRTIVHHVIAYIIPPEWADEYDALDGADGKGPGYNCFGGAGGPADQGYDDPEDAIRWLAGWAPGGSGSIFPQYTGIPVEGGSRIVMQVHYNVVDAVEGDGDVSTLEIMTTSNPFGTEWALIQPFADVEWLETDKMHIPAGESATHSVEIEMDQDFLVYSAGMHMHTMGQQATFSHRKKGGEEDCMLQIDQWDFNWQRSYGFQQPKLVESGDSLYMECTWDNDTDEDVYWGEGTGDEMCLGTMYVTAAP